MTGVRQKAMLSSRVLVQATKSGSTLATGIRSEGQGRHRRADQDERHPPADGRTQPVRPGADRRLDQQGGDVIERHEEADPGRGETEFIRQEERHESVVHAPDDTDAEETKAKQEGLAVVEFHALLHRVQGVSGG